MTRSDRSTPHLRRSCGRLRGHFIRVVALMALPALAVAATLPGAASAVSNVRSHPPTSIRTAAHLQAPATPLRALPTAPRRPAGLTVGGAAISGTSFHPAGAPAAINGATLRTRTGPAAIDGAAVRRPRP